MVKTETAGVAEPGLGGARPGLIVLALSVFAAVTTEMAPVGLLPAIGHSFGVAESTAGLLVSLYAVLVAALAVPLTLATRRVPGKRLLLIAMSSYAVSNLVSALAPSLAVLAAGRALGGAPTRCSSPFSSAMPPDWCRPRRQAGPWRWPRQGRRRDSCLAYR